MPASRRQLALKVMKEAEGASLIGKIISRFIGDFIALSRDRAPSSLRIDEGQPLRCHPRGVGVIYTLAHCHEHGQRASCPPRASPSLGGEAGDRSSDSFLSLNRMWKGCIAISRCDPDPICCWNAVTTSGGATDRPQSAWGGPSPDAIRRGQAVSKLR
jgi:hypothetical protein